MWQWFKSFNYLKYTSVRTLRNTRRQKIVAVILFSVYQQLLYLDTSCWITWTKKEKLSAIEISIKESHARYKATAKECVYHDDTFIGCGIADAEYENIIKYCNALVKRIPLTLGFSQAGQP